jgi:YD repeat-containing protein
MARDGLGRLTGITPPGRPQHRLFRDIEGRITEYRPPDNGASIFYTYDAWGFSRISSGGRAVDFTRDDAGRIVRARLNRGDYSLAYTGEAPTQIVSPDGLKQDLIFKGTEVVEIANSGGVAGTVRFTYDAGRRITSRRINSRPAIPFTFDDDGLPLTAGALTLTRNAATGAVTGRSLGTVSEATTFDGFGEPTSLTVTAGATPIASFTRTFDKLGRILTETETIAGESSGFEFIYDSHGRLAAVR